MVVICFPVYGSHRKHRWIYHKKFDWFPTAGCQKADLLAGQTSEPMIGLKQQPKPI
jgi:hypothetical protein